MVFDGGRREISSLLFTFGMRMNATKAHSVKQLRVMNPLMWTPKASTRTSRDLFCPTGSGIYVGIDSQDDDMGVGIRQPNTCINLRMGGWSCKQEPCAFEPSSSPAVNSPVGCMPVPHPCTCTLPASRTHTLRAGMHLCVPVHTWTHTGLAHTRRACRSFTAATQHVLNGSLK